MNIYLIGYRCTGKTTVGKLLSQRLGWPFIDMDLELTRQLATTISDFVDRNGWQAFRRQERAVLKQVSFVQRHVVATGGGIILNPKNISDMKASGTLIWLKASPQKIKDRIRRDTHTQASRPALTSKGLIEEIEETLSNRHPVYQQAMNFSVDTDDLNVEDICKRILRKLPGHLYISLSDSAAVLNADSSRTTKRS